MEIIEVCCLIVPSGESLWFEADQGQEYAMRVLDKWKADNREYQGAGCTSGLVVIKMPKKQYQVIAAQYGGGAYIFPPI